MARNPFHDQVDDIFRGRRVRVQTAAAVYEGWLQIREYSQNAVLIRDAERADGDAVVGDVVVHDVQTLELCHDKTTIEQVPIDALEPSPYTQRSFDTADFREFVRTIRDRGHLNNLPLVRPLDDERYEIVSGHKRYEAARQAGLDTIAAEIRDLDDWDATTIFLDEHVPISHDEAAAADDPYSGFYTQSELEAALDALRDDWGDEQLRDHQALAWYLDAESPYPNDDDEQPSPADGTTNGDESACNEDEPHE